MLTAVLRQGRLQFYAPSSPRPGPSASLCPSPLRSTSDATDTQQPPPPHLQTTWRPGSTSSRCVWPAQNHERRLIASQAWAVAKVRPSMLPCFETPPPLTRASARPQSHLQPSRAKGVSQDQQTTGHGAQEWRRQYATRYTTFQVGS